MTLNAPQEETPPPEQESGATANATKKPHPGVGVRRQSELEFTALPLGDIHVSHPPQ